MSELEKLLLITAAASALPAWLTTSILKKHATKAGEPPSAWIPLDVLPFALKRFVHPQRAAILFGWIASNLLFTGAVVGVLILRFGK